MSNSLLLLVENKNECGTRVGSLPHTYLCGSLAPVQPLPSLSLYEILLLQYYRS